jgi:hypothetical protein
VPVSILEWGDTFPLEPEFSSTLVKTGKRNNQSQTHERGRASGVKGKG